MHNWWAIFPNLFFSKTNNTKIIPLIIFYITIVISITKFCKRKRDIWMCMDIFHIWLRMNTCMYLYMFIHIKCIKSFSGYCSIFIEEKEIKNTECKKWTDLRHRCVLTQHSYRCAIT